MKKSPLAQMKERFTDKAGLLKAVEGLASGDLWIDRTNADKGLAHVSNSKLLKLHDALSAVKKEFGSRAALITAILKAEKRPKDEGYKARLERFPAPRLLDAHRSAAKRTKAAAAPTAAAAPAPVAKKATVKAAATKVPAKKAPAKKAHVNAPTKKAVKKS